MAREELSPGFRVLRMMVIIMGIVLFFGTIAFMVAVYIKFNKPPAPEHSFAMQQPAQMQALPAPAGPPPPSSEKCTFKPIANIVLGGEVVNSVLNGNILTLTIEQAAKPLVINKIQQGNSLTLSAEPSQASQQQLIIFDLCKGITLSRLIVEAN